MNVYLTQGLFIKEYSNELGQVLALHKRFSVLSDDIQTGDTNSATALSVLNNSHNFQVLYAQCCMFLSGCLTKKSCTVGQ